MTVLDTSVPHYPVLMTLGAHEHAPEVILAPGYEFVLWDDRYREPWVRLHVTLGQLPSVGEGLDYFDRTYGSDPETLRRQMLLVCDEQGRLAGTSSVWRGDHFGEPRLRVHWVGVSPDHQRKGLAKALMLKTIALYDELLPRCEAGELPYRAAPLYLTTQTESYIAIGMYLRLGFEPYRGPRPAHFGDAGSDFERDNERAWEIVERKLAATFPGALPGRR